MKNKPEKVVNVLTTFSHIISVSRFFGQIPIPVGKSTFANRLISKINSIVYLSIYIVLLFMLIFDWDAQFQMAGQNTQLASYIRRIKTVVGLLIMLIIVGYTPFRESNLVTLVSLVQEIDDELKIMNITLDYKKIQKRINWCFYAFLATAITYLGTDFAVRSVCLISSTGEWVHGMTIIAQMVCEAEIVSLAWLLANRFQILNDYLNNFHTSKISSSDIYWMTPVGAKSTRLSVVSRIHDKLCILCRKVENAFASQLVLIIAQCFVAVIYKMYILFSSMLRVTNDCFAPFATVSIIFDLMNIVLIVVFTSAASIKVIQIKRHMI